MSRHRQTDSSAAASVTELALIESWLENGGWDAWLSAWCDARRCFRTVGMHTGLYLDVLPELFPAASDHRFAFAGTADGG